MKFGTFMCTLTNKDTWSRSKCSQVQMVTGGFLLVFFIQLRYIPYITLKLSATNLMNENFKIYYGGVVQ